MARCILSHNICLQNSSPLQTYQVLVSLSHPSTNFHSFFANPALCSTDTSYLFLSWINIIKLNLGQFFQPVFLRSLKFAPSEEGLMCLKGSLVFFHLYQFGLIKYITSPHNPYLSWAHLKGEKCLPSKKHSWQVISPDCLQCLWRLFAGS